MTLSVQLVSPERILYEDDATAVLCRSVGGGDVMFLTDHAPFIGALATWPVKITTESGDEQWFAVHGGFVEVSNNNVTLLSDVAELADQVDVQRAERARDAANDALRSDPEDLDAQAALDRAEVRIQVANP